MLAPNCSRGAAPTDRLITGTSTSLASVPCQRNAEIESATAPGCSMLASSIQAKGTALVVVGAATFDDGSALWAGGVGLRLVPGELPLLPPLPPPRPCAEAGMTPA